MQKVCNLLPEGSNTSKRIGNNSETPTARSFVLRGFLKGYYCTVGVVWFGLLGWSVVNDGIR